MTKTILIVGAGFFGVSAANRLAKLKRDYKIKLVSPSKYAYYIVGSARATVYNTPEGTVIPLTELLYDSIEIVHDDVVKFDEDTVYLSKNEDLKFDALILATGSKWADPIGSTNQFKDNYREYFKTQSDRLSKAKHIVLIGGGVTNVELAAELNDKYKTELKNGSKKITLIHNSDKLLPSNGFYTESTRDKAMSFFQNSTNVELILGSKANYEEGSNIVEVNGTKIEADLIYHNIGVEASVPDNDLQGFVNDYGFIKVNDTFQTVNTPKIFAIGDVTDFKVKGLVHRFVWLPTIVSNVDLFLQSRPSTEFKTVIRPTGFQTFAITLGKKAGVGQVSLYGYTFGLPSFLVVLLKSRNVGLPFAKFVLGSS